MAACVFELPISDQATIEIQVTPAGEFRPNDGRAIPVKAWRIDAAIAARVIERFRARKTPPVLDYEHQSLHKENNGQVAPAAGWFQSLTWREGQGLYATVELTQRARDYIRAGEYRYFSPVFLFDPDSGAVLDLLMGAITNTPAIDGLEPLAALAAALSSLTQEPPTMHKLLLAICAALGLTAASTTEDQAVAALNAQFDEFKKLRAALGIGDDLKADSFVAACAALKARADEAKALRTAFGLADNIASTEAIAACTAIKVKADAAAAVDPAKYVPIAAVEDMRAQLAVLTAKSRDGEVAALVEAGLADGKLLPALKGWATDLGKKDLAALTSYLAAATPIAALTSTQTRGVSPLPTGADAHGLTAEQLAVCTNCGITPEAFAASLKSITGGVA